MAIKNNIVCFLFLAFASFASAHIGEFDEYWHNRTEEAKRIALESYHPNPLEVTDHLNLNVHLALQGGNSTRRGLKPYTGRCMATNPIDRCWRCRKNWATDRKRLARCVLGFGRRTTGGLKGRFYLVTDPSDHDMLNPRPGTLRHAVIQTEPLWIIFKCDMVIVLQQELMITSHKTIDARGAKVHIAHGAGLT
ncbi:hypothetical protein ACQCRO_27650, partial [Ralstonia pseudosolanacearum]|uniref:hypothetical protein n=1 Tax=Ralstonia pseudosolanacearum TaxID=1310165 RepID=UPI003CECBD57